MEQQAVNLDRKLSLQVSVVAPTVSTWDGPDDPDNPRNWPLWERLYGVFIPAWLALSTTLGTSVYAPAAMDISEHFNVSRTAALVGVSIYALGFALGPVIGAPISETLGRRWVYTLTMPVSLLFTMGAGLSQTFPSLLICRFFAAFTGAPCIAIGAGSIADLFDMQKGGGMAAVLFTQMPFLGSSVGPLLGGYAVQNQKSWRWSMWVMLMIGGAAWVASLFLRETYAKQILKARAKKRGIAPPPKPPPIEALRLLLTVTLFRPVHMLLFEPIVGWMSLYSGFTFGILFAFFDAFPYVFGRIYGFHQGQVGLTYLGIIVGILLATITFGVIDKTLYAKAKARVTVPGMIPPPEERLYACFLGSIALPISLFWFGWTARASIHWIVPLLAGLPFGWGLILLFLGTSTYLVDAYQAMNAASAIAANSLLRYVIAAAFPLFTVQMYEKLGIGWASSLLGFVALAMLPIPWILYRWGPLLRKRTAYPMGNF